MRGAEVDSGPEPARGGFGVIPRWSAGGYAGRTSKVSDSSGALYAVWLTCTLIVSPRSAASSNASVTFGSG